MTPFILRRLLVLLALGLSAVTRAETLGLSQLFSVEQNPGSGSLAYKQGTKTETIDFGKVAGHYGMGVVFRGSLLPAPYSKMFQERRIIQIAFGTLRGSLQGQVPQFGSATLITDGIPERRTRLKLVTPNGKDPSLKQLALLLFSSPSTPSEQSDEEKLKTTFFAQGGALTVTPAGPTKTIRLKSQGKTLSFKTKMLELEFDAKLLTPFNTQETTIQGRMELPIYWPIGNDTKALAHRIATESLGTAPTLPPATEGLTSHKREISGSTKKDTGSR